MSNTWYTSSVVTHFTINFRERLRILHILETVNILKLQNPEVSSKQAKWYS